jgi:hypothetical protein
MKRGIGAPAEHLYREEARANGEEAADCLRAFGHVREPLIFPRKKEK